MSNTRTIIEIPEFVTVRELATLMGVSPINIIKELMSNGIMANINQQIDFDTAAIVAEELGYEPRTVTVEQEEVDEEALPTWHKVLAGEKEANLESRPPVITMLGHVDHGKTSLLDYIRRADVQTGEAGGITQHIGAYQARYDNRLITFLDTPGHEAFTAMRARGAKATDIAILVVAADDGVMPTTREALDHARAAHVPVVVALNKIDLPNANVPFAMQQLSDAGLVPDEWDGDTMVIQVSAKTGDGIEDLLEAILLTADEIQPRANPHAEPSGVVLEARLERGRGITATLLVQNGTLKLGDTIIAGEHFGRIKAMYDYNGQRVKEAVPSTPVSVSGLNGMPEAGDRFETVSSEKEARKVVAERESQMEHMIVAKKPVSLEDFLSNLAGETEKKLLLIVKADVQGSLEPLVKGLERLGNDEVSLEILHAATGRISESDVMLASASDAVIVGFNVDVDSAANVAAKSEKVEINVYTIIYKLFEDIELALNGMLDPIYEDAIIGRAEVRAVFRVKGVGNIAGCYMRTGVARRNAQARVIRDGRLLHEGDVSSLKHLADNVREVKTGFEFGVGISNFNDFKEDDIIEFTERKRVR
ncbi:MAG: translation initiation factor IF-2 [Anaerolineae bacterium]|nr:translation initiation factor IF-2 [Anaerolineae bacterium]